jgi:hypothetical protein
MRGTAWREGAQSAHDVRPDAEPSRSESPAAHRQLGAGQLGSGAELRSPTSFGARIRRAARLVPLMLAILGVPAVVMAVDVRGTLTVPSDLASLTPNETPAQTARARYWEEWNGVLDPRSSRIDPAREMAVVLTGSGPMSEGEQPPYRIHNGSLMPATIVTRAGAPIDLQNADGVSYQLYAEGLSDFGPLQTAAGNPRRITVPSPGNWPVRDRVYGHVRGHLHTLPDLVARAFVEPNGAYTFRGVAAGTYQLHVFHGPREIATQEVVVPESGQLTVPAIALTAAAP